MRYTTLSLLIGITLVGVGVGFGCSATGGGSEFNTGGSGGAGSGILTGAGNGQGGSIITVGAGSQTGSGSGGGCSDAAKLIYLLSQANDLYSFKPDTKAVKKIGPLKCAANGAQPNSMAIDRDAWAWVNYVESNGIGDSAGHIFKVSTADASCTPTPITLPPMWYRLGMGFATDAVGGTAETLYVDGTAAIVGMGNGPGLGRIDFGKNTVVPIGNFGGALNGQSCELTGTGDARLFGFFTTTPVQLAELSKATGAGMSPVSFPMIQMPYAWAFSFWGGDFYFYTAPLDASVMSTVTHYMPATGMTDYAYIPNIGFRIVGAGVSTCAPTEPPPK